MFEFLFNVTFQELPGARVQFAWSIHVLLLALLAGVFVALLCSGYLGARHRAHLLVLRAGVAVIVVLIAARPQLLLPRPDSVSGAVAVLVDDSASMSIEDAAGGVSRARAVDAVLAAKSGVLARALEARFDVRYMRFDARLHDQRVDGGIAAAAADREAPSTHTARAGTDSSAVSNPLGATVDAVTGGGIAAVVLVSDSGQVSGVDERELLGRLRALGVAVHVLGVGDSQLAPDVSVEAVAVPPRVLNDDEVAVRVELSAAGFAGQTVNLTVTDNGILAGEQAVLVDAARFRRSVQIPIRAHESGLRRIEVRVQVPPGDRVVANDSFVTSLNVRSQPVRVLHFETQPRFEVKFLRRALADDRALSLSSLVRTGDNRFLRLGIGAQEELADGFPSTARELFAYQVLVIGSVNVASFTEQQLQLLEDFVNVRGGSVLFLGGRHSFAAGGWGESPISRIMPVLMNPVEESFNVAAWAKVTTAGLEHAVTRDLFEGRDEAQTARLPALAMVNPIRRVKRGASVLLQGDDGSDSPLVMLAWQRFGAGRVAALPVRDTWRWRMHADMPLHDRTHELFWRRLLRWLARDVPSRLSVRAIPVNAAPGQSVRLQASVRDEQWREVNDARPVARVTTPLGDIVERLLSGSDGGHDHGDQKAARIFSSRYIARDSGLYEVHIADERTQQPAADSLLATDNAAGLMVSVNGEEFVTPALRDERLRRIAGVTGGSYRHLNEAGDLVARIVNSVPVVQAWHRIALWNAPILLFALLLLSCSEWWLRRQRRHLP